MGSWTIRSLYLKKNLQLYLWASGQALDTEVKDTTLHTIAQSKSKALWVCGQYFSSMLEIFLELCLWASGLVLDTEVEYTTIQTILQSHSRALWVCGQYFPSLLEKFLQLHVSVGFWAGLGYRALKYNNLNRSR